MLNVIYLLLWTITAVSVTMAAAFIYAAIAGRSDEIEALTDRISLRVAARQRRGERSEP